MTTSHKMGLDTVAEGVETDEDRAVLVELGCDLMQGYLFARPARAFLSAGALQSLAAAGKRPPRAVGQACS